MRILLLVLLLTGCASLDQSQADCSQSSPNCHISLDRIHIDTEVDCSDPKPMINVKGPIIEQDQLWQIEIFCGKGKGACLFMQPDGMYQPFVLKGHYKLVKHEWEHELCGEGHVGDMK